MARQDATTILSRAFVLWCGVVAVGALYFAKEVLLPLALAILLSFLLGPMVSRLERWRFRRIPAVLVVVAVVFTTLGGLGYMLGQQIYELASRLPEYKGNIVAKIESLQVHENGVIKSIGGMIEEVREKFSHKAPDPHPPSPAPPHSAKDPSQGKSPLPSVDEAAPDDGGPMRPTPVEVVNNDLSATQIAQTVLGPIVAPLGTGAMVLVFVVFMLIERESLRNRVIHVMGSRQLTFATQAIDEAASRIRRYLLMQVIVNSTFGIVIAIGLFFLGMPNALLWGVLATVLRFIPYIGAWISATIPVALAAAIFPGWTTALLVLGLFIANELISNNVIEPWLYGSSTGISTVGIIVSAVFWTWLWGPAGLIMATPLTVCLIVMGRYVPQLAFINTLLSEDESLPTEARLYQRLLAMDAEEATDIAEEYLKEHSLESLYDDVLLPALSLAERDRHQGDLEESKERFVLNAMRELVDDLGSHAAAATTVTDEANGVAYPAPFDIPVVCLPARDEADEIAGMMLRQLLQAKGLRVVLVSVQSLSSEMLERVAEEAPGVVCISAVPPLAATHARYLCKRLRPKFPALRLVVGLWQETNGVKKTEARLKDSGANEFVKSLAQATQLLVLTVAAQHQFAAAEIAPGPACAPAGAA